METPALFMCKIFMKNIFSTECSLTDVMSFSCQEK